MNYRLTESQKNKIIETWGEDFYSKTLHDIEIYSEKWKLSEFAYVEHYSRNAIFLCESELYGNCVLKAYSEDAEYNTLRAYNGRRFVKAFERENGVMLVERIIPGKMLKNESYFENRLAVFSELFNGLHIEPENPEIYGSYTKFIDNRIEYMKTCEYCEELYVYMLKAKEIYSEMLTVYNKKSLLHGDLHFENILLNIDGKYKIIDPYGDIGDPIFEVGHYMSAEYMIDKPENQYKTMVKMIEYFEKNLNIPNEILRKCFYIDTVASECCRVAGGHTANLGDVEFAENFMR